MSKSKGKKEKLIYSSSVDIPGVGNIGTQVYENPNLIAPKCNPIRVQRKRTKGFKLPPNTVCVDRTSKWGNPFKVASVYERLNSEKAKVESKYLVGSVEAALAYYELLIKSRIANKELDINELKGKNLACFCPLNQPCHADILLKLANE